MRFLVDTNLPRALAHRIHSLGHSCEHVLDLGLAQANDREIWQRAAATGAVIVTKDEDFADRVRRTENGPAVVWIRTGNGTNRQLLAYLEPLWPKILMRLDVGDRLVELR